MFDGLFIFQCFFFWMQKYFIKIILEWEIIIIDKFFIQLEVFVRACRYIYIYFFFSHSKSTSPDEDFLLNQNLSIMIISDPKIFLHSEKKIEVKMRWKINTYLPSILPFLLSFCQIQFISSLSLSHTHTHIYINVKWRCNGVIIKLVGNYKTQNHVYRDQILSALKYSW